MWYNVFMVQGLGQQGYGSSSLREARPPLLTSGEVFWPMGGAFTILRNTPYNILDHLAVLWLIERTLLGR